MSSLSLHARLAAALPDSLNLLIHHVVSDSFKCPEIFAAPPDELPEPTKSESHFLSASIQHDGKPLQVFALEVYVYTTDTLTTIFVSKADSTGYLQLLATPKGTTSPIKAVITTFLEWLVETKRREDTRLLLSLFARAQNQYLFPGSIENAGKHVLNDRGLIKWWCQVLDPILLRYEDADSEYEAHAHLIVPGLDAYETRAYFPKPSISVSRQKPRWSAIDPLQSLGKAAGLPARCYIPRFPDDPKARFVIDLDDELPDTPEGEDQIKGKSPGIWKSVKSLAQFWELMSFRQECGAGRLVGFIWSVFEPLELVNTPNQARIDAAGSQTETADEPTLPTPGDSQYQSNTTTRMVQLPTQIDLEPIEDRLATPLPSSQLRPEDEESQDDKVPIPAPTRRGLSPFAATSTDTGLRLSDAAYKNALLLLDTLDYANVEIAIESTAKFIEALSKDSDVGTAWAMDVKGTATVDSLGLAKANAVVGSEYAVSSPVNVINTGLVRSKKRSAEETSPVKPSIIAPEVRVLSSSLVRKKPKV